MSIPQEHSEKGFTFLMATWIGITLIAWVALSVVVSLAVGGMIRVADGRRTPSVVPTPLHPRRRAAAPLRRVS